LYRQLGRIAGAVRQGRIKPIFTPFLCLTAYCDGSLPCRVACVARQSTTHRARLDQAQHHHAHLAIAAIGIVYGYTGTGPLYTMKEVFSSEHGIALDRANLPGVVSLIVWGLTIIVSLKYVTLILRADNRGEGRVMSLMALALCEAHGLEPETMETSFFFARQTVISTVGGMARWREGLFGGMARWREGLFAAMSRNARDAADYYRVRVNRVIELGIQVEI
jgi:K+ transporter